jgi:hypothetical protein
MKIPTKDYSDYKIGDLLLYKEGQDGQDIGYIRSIEEDEENFEVMWFGNDFPSDENVETLKDWNNGFVFPVSKT